MFNQNNKPTWDCFVCFKKFPRTNDGWEEFCKHMFDEHEEGRDYIRCNFCQSPIRDLIAHCKIKHPGMAIPANVPHRSLIWKDQKTKRGKKKHEFKKGQFISLKNEGKVVQFRSSWELEMFNLLESWIKVERYEVETLKIPYYWKGRWRTYIPDLKIYFADGSISIFEIKPACQAGFEINQAKWTACKKICDENNWRFEVITLERIRQLQGLLLEQRRNK